ncbi:hypothetical protein O0L34_g13747 [Tuta absoluta]|nr:hypothetical protein O0L34_g13747 [Tuta absoluta]
MAPSPQEDVYNGIHLTNGMEPLSGEEIVISGMSGIFPKSKNVTEFMDNLFNKVDMVTPAFQNVKHSEAPKYMGKIEGGEKFDAQFFRVTYNQAVSLDPATRKSMEQAYAAMYDAGENPLIYKGRKIGVYAGNGYSDAGSIGNMYTTLSNNNFAITGFSTCMIANRVSYFLDAKAPSVFIAGSCASSMNSLESAYNGIKSGICEAALVAACQICIHHILPINLRKAGLLSLDGKTRCFDKDGDGYVRSEAISYLFLQKAKNAKRIYAEVRAIKTTYALQRDEKFLPIRKQEHIVDFLENFYSEAGVSPKDVEYVEANGAALPEGDINELQAISDVFANERSVMVGCVKSNMGSSESAASLCGITKMCLAYHRGEMPGNLHYNSPFGISSVQEGKVKILTENTPFKRGLAAINTFTYNGMDCHALLKGHFIPKNLTRYDCKIPRLVCVSGRQDEGIINIFNILKKQPVDPELIGMLHNIYKIDIPGHTCRGYTIIDTDNNKKTISLSQSVQLYQGARRPLWLVFSGMGSQWAGMGAELMRIPIFAAAIEKCSKVLEPKGIDIVRIITEPDAKIVDEILNCYVGIAAIQVGLTDILKAVGLVPDGILGHSVGEMGCAYFDGGFTAEEFILAAYFRGLVSVETKFIEGSMAAIGLGYKDVLPIVPPTIDIACRNSSESCTISGPASCVTKFVNDLKSRGIFAKEVPTGNIAYHSRYIKDGGPKFLKLLKEFMSTPVPRSDKWICSSLPPEQWNDPIAKHSSAEYHLNNLLSPVYFEDAAMLIPPDAVVVEVAPHGLLQAILKRSHPDCSHIPLTKKGHSNPVIFLLDSLGKLYSEGYNPKIEVLYPKIEYPVSTETPMLSHFVDWYHQEQWPTAKFSNGVHIKTAKRTFSMFIEDDDYRFISGHVKNGDVLYPEAGVLFLIWETFAMYKGEHYENLPVAFRDVQFHGDITIDLKKVMRLNILITKGQQYFEITRDDNVVASGFIETLTNCDPIKIEKDHSMCSECIKLDTEDIYNIFRAKGYDYKNEFESIKTSSNNWDTAEIKWTRNWITMLDSLIQLNILARNHDGISAVKLIKYLNIKVDDHVCKKDVYDTTLTVQHDKLNGRTRCDGIEMGHIIINDIPVEIEEPDVLQTFSFIPHCAFSQVKLKKALQINLQLVADNLPDNIINIMAVEEIRNMNKIMESIAKYIPDVILKFHTNQGKEMQSFSKMDLIVYENLFSHSEYYHIYNNIKNNTFVLTFEREWGIDIESNHAFNVISTMDVEEKKMILLRKTSTNDTDICFIPVTYDNKYLWVSRMHCELQVMRKVILVTEKESLNGVFGLMQKLKKDYHDRISVIILEDDQAPAWDPENVIYREQLKKNLVFNVMKQGQWGSYYYLPSHNSTLFTSANFNLVNSLAGDIDSMKWVASNSESKGKNVIKVCFAGPSLRDAQKAVGLVEPNTKGFGMDFSGLDSKGNRVMGLVKCAALSSTVEADLDLLWPVPEHWTLEEAATVPLPYLHALYCLTIKGQLLPRHSVFVTGGSGALGQAVISLCLGLGCTVYTSVGDSHKKRFLLKLFPQLCEHNIGYSYDGSFINTIFNDKKNKCDFVINCMSGPDRELAMNSVGAFGIFFDLNAYNIQNNNDFGMYYLDEERSYSVVNLSAIFHADNEKKALQKSLSEGIATGIVKPLSYVTYSTEEVSKAFRFLTTRKHRGRVLIDIGNNTEKLAIVPRMKISPTGTYIVVCDDTQLGIELANRLVKHGAKQITLHMKHKKSKGYLDIMLAHWKKLNISVSISTDNLNCEMSCVKFLIDEQVTAQVHGIFIVQGCTKSETCEQEDFVQNSTNLISIVSNLSLVSKNNCPELRYFAIISRTSQNPVDKYTTSVLEKICKERAEINLPSLVFRVVMTDKNQLSISKTNLKPLTITVALNALETCLGYKHDNVLAYNVNESISEDDGIIMEKILRIIGVGNIEEINEDMALNSLLTNEVVIEELKLAIKEYSGIEFSAEELKKTSLSRLRALSTMHNVINTKFESGMNAFYNFVDEDEIEATQVLIPMPTACEFTDNELYLETDSTYLMLLPGFEGHHHIFKSICERLKIGAVALQLRPNVNDNSIHETAVDIKSHIMKRFSMKSKFYLLGYSYGVNVALEVAALFEKDGLTGVVYCLDSSPDALRVQLDAYLGHQSESQLQNSIIAHLFKVMTGETNEQLTQELKEISEWSKKIDLCLHYLYNRVSYTFEYCKDILEAAYKRMNLALNYKPNFRLESDIVLLKGIPHPKAETLPYDYNLSKYSKKPVKVFEINSDVASATEDRKVSNIVNRLLDPSLLEEFKKRNLCETYIVDEYTN